MTSRFTITRPDGRSNAQVILDLVRDKRPGTIFAYEEIARALEEGCERRYDRAAVQAIVVATQARMLREQERTLINLRDEGYRLSHANDHGRLALDRKERADQQIARGVLLLEKVKTDEMDPQAREAHEAVVVILGGMYRQQAAMEKRVEKRIQAIEAALGIGRRSVAAQ